MADGVGKKEKKMQQIKFAPLTKCYIVSKETNRIPKQCTVCNGFRKILTMDSIEKKCTNCVMGLEMETVKRYVHRDCVIESIFVTDKGNVYTCTKWVDGYGVKEETTDEFLFEHLEDASKKCKELNNG
jgi:hypothetical protein